MKYRYAPEIRFAFAIAIALSMPAVSRGDTPDHVLRLWPKHSPGPERNVGAEQDFTKDSDDLIAGRRIIKLGNVSTPEAHVYLPPENRRTGASVVICPGGGFHILAWDLEGTEIAQWLNTLGVAGIVLKYRVPTANQEQSWLAPAQDAQRTISLVRHHAKDWKLDKQQVGVLGFSAGGMTAFKTSLHANRLYETQDDVDQETFRPNRTMLIYAAGLPESAPSEDPNAETLVTSDFPPTFAIHTFDDFVPVQGTANLMLAMKKAGVPMELHVFDRGGHGYGMRTDANAPVTRWASLCESWLRQAKWVD